MVQSVYLILENGEIFEGKSFGSTNEIVGELVFTTAMCGYLETLTDPSYYGQFVIQTFPLIGNYGIIPEDFESSKPCLKAYIVKEWCRDPSNFRCEGDLDTFLKQNNIVGIYDIDTRALTKIVRVYGVMNAAIRFNPDNTSVLPILKEYHINDAVKNVSCKTKTNDHSTDSKYKVVLWDFGAKANIKRQLLKHGCDVITVPSSTSAEEIINLSPDGIMLSNGPGDPAENVELIRQIQLLQKSGIPIFGICLGHQLLALANGAKTSKLKYGHRGANQPVIHVESQKVYITSQNHGYFVEKGTLPDYASVSYLNVNDDTCEGIVYRNSPAFSVQYHPEAAGGPLDTEFLFDDFISLMKGANEHAAQ